MKSIFEKVIQRGGYNLPKMLQRIDEYHIDGKLTDEEREELIAAARGEATPGMDVNAEIQLLWAELKKQTARVDKLEGIAAGDDATGGTVSEYHQPTGAHDAYYGGDKVTYNGKVYMCKAPDGVACVWSPDEMPGYWEEL